MLNSLQCEAGRIGKKLRQAKLPLNYTMVVTAKDTQTISGLFGFGAKLANLFDFSGEVSQEQLREASSDGLEFNLHPDNYEVCTGYKNRTIKEGVGAYTCLAETKFPTLAYAMRTKKGSAGCHYKITLVEKVSAGAKVPVWGIPLGPSGSYSDTAVYDMVVAAPPKKGEK